MPLPVTLGSIVLMLSAASWAPAQQAPSAPMALHRLSGPIRLDGVLDEPAWQDVQPLPMSMFSPVFGGALTERTEVLVAYDQQFVYVGGRMFDSEPRGIRVNTLYRDQYSGDDLLAIVLDTYNDYETASWFVVNPAAARSDRAVSNDGEFTSGFPMNSDWNTYWDVATSQNGEGWFAEMRIPLSSLGFQVTADSVVMGMIVYRFIARKNERQLFPAIPPNWPLAFAKPSQAHRVVLRDVRSSRPAYVTPYFLGGLRQESELILGGSAYATRDDVTREAGVDLRWSLTDNLSLDLTANTDFAQVEADDAQVNLTRFSLFFPEKRQFFQERAAIFDFNTGGPSRLFHSRRIGLVSSEPVRLLGGARLVGRVGGTDIGALNMQTAGAGGAPAENFGVVRLKRQVLNSFSSVGAMATSRVAGAGGYNVAIGVDALMRTVGDEYLTLKAVQTFDDGGSTSVGDPDALRLLARWERRDLDGFSYAAGVVRSGRAYSPGVGFVLRDDFTSGDAEIRYQWFPGDQSPLRSVRIAAQGEGFWRNADRSLETATFEPSVQTELKNGIEVVLSGTANRENILEEFELSGGTTVPDGEYRFYGATLDFMASRAAMFRPSWQVSYGSFFDGTRLSVSARPAWNPSRYLELGVEYDFNAIRFDERGQAATLHVARLRIRTALDVHFSLSTLVQYSSADDATTVNARLRYNFREGQDLWVVYNELFNTDRDVVGGPRLPLSSSRGLMVKYTHTLTW